MKIRLYCRAYKSQGGYIYIDLRSGNDRARANLQGVNCTPAQWDRFADNVNKKHPHYSELYSLIYRIKEGITATAQMNPLASCAEIIRIAMSRPQILAGDDLAEAWAQHIDMMRSRGRHGNALVHANARAAMIRFFGDQLQAAALNKRNMQMWHDSMMHLSINTRRNYLASCKAAIRAIYPDIDTTTIFAGLIKQGKSTPNVITAADIKLMRSAATTPRLIKAMDVFIFSALAQGMAFVDVAHLRPSDIRNNALNYVRHKTRAAKITVNLPHTALNLIEKYKDENNTYIFDLIKEHKDSSNAAFKAYRLAQDKYEKAIRIISKQANVKVKPYDARHTWATIAIAANVDIATIRSALGHTNINTTNNYLHSLKNAKELADINNIVANVLDI